MCCSVWVRTHVCICTHVYVCVLVCAYSSVCMTMYVTVCVCMCAHQECVCVRMSGSQHTCQISHLLLCPSPWLLVPGLSSWFLPLSPRAHVQGESNWFYLYVCGHINCQIWRSRHHSKMLSLQCREGEITYFLWSSRYLKGAVSIINHVFLSGHAFHPYPVMPCVTAASNAHAQTQHR